MADEAEETEGVHGRKEKKRGPRGGVKHEKYGRGHDSKSGPIKKRRFQRKAEKKRKEEKARLLDAWEEWDALPPYVQNRRPELKPKGPRPTDEK